jgi:hypothetical protein
MRFVVRAPFPMCARACVFVAGCGLCRNKGSLAACRTVGCATCRCVLLPPHLAVRGRCLDVHEPCCHRGPRRASRFHCVVCCGGAVPFPRPAQLFAAVGAVGSEVCSYRDRKPLRAQVQVRLESNRTHFYPPPLLPHTPSQGLHVPPLRLAPVCPAGDHHRPPSLSHLWRAPWATRPRDCRAMRQLPVHPCQGPEPPRRGRPPGSRRRR